LRKIDVSAGQERYMEKEIKYLPQDFLKEIVRRILRVAQPEKIILFGSFARNEATEASDLDLLIIQSTSSLPRYKRSTPVRLALRGLFPSKDILIYTQKEVQDWKTAETSFIASILREGTVLYERQ
jgi:predicted nucleotidyltransferase